MTEGRTQIVAFIALIVVLGGGLALLRGCKHVPKISQRLALPEDVAAAMASPEDEAGMTPGIAINVYIDGSGSIEHFLHETQSDKKSNAGPAESAAGRNYLADLLDRIGQAKSVPGWQNGHDIRFWRFGGNSPKPLSVDDLAEMRNSPSHKSFPENETRIEVPFEPMESSGPHASPELKIVITDLYESNLDMGKLGEGIAARYLASTSKYRGAVCILAIRNPFYGRVDDLPGKKSGGPFATSMPIYVLLAGPARDVRFAVKALLVSLELQSAFEDNKAKLIFFLPETDHLAKGAPEFDEADRGSHLITDDYRGSSLSLFTLQRGTLTLRWRDAGADRFLYGDKKDFWKPAWTISPSATDKVKFQAVVYSHAGKPGDDDPPGADDLDLAQVASPCPSDDGVCMSVDGTRLRPGQDYRFRANLFEKGSESFRVGAAELRIWSIDKGVAEHLSAQPDAHFPALSGVSDPNPGLTPDLSLFLAPLQGEIFPDASTAMANHHYVYIHAQ